MLPLFLRGVFLLKTALFRTYLFILVCVFKSSKDQRLVYSGKLLLDHFTLKDVLRKVSFMLLNRRMKMVIFGVFNTFLSHFSDD